MHQPIQESLEGYLAGSLSPQEMLEFHRHLSSCDDCRKAVGTMRQQSELLQVLKAPEDALEPQAGFYARVLACIETQIRPSIWSLFLQPAFARRLLYSSLLLVVLMGSLILTTPRSDLVSASTPEGILSQEQYPPAYGADVDNGRDVVLVNLATYSGD